MVEELMVVQDYRTAECFSPICVKAAAVPQCYTMCLLKSMRGRCFRAGWTTFEEEKKGKFSCQLGLQCGMRYWYRSEALSDPYSGSKNTSVLLFHYVAAMLHLRGISKTHSSLFTVRYSWMWSRGASVPRPVRNSGLRPGVEPPNIKWFRQEWDLSAVSVRGAVSWKPPCNQRV